MFTSLCDGRSKVYGLGTGADNQATIEAMRQLGVEIEAAADAVAVNGVGLRGLSAPTDTIDCGNSGTSMRLLAGVLAGQHFSSVLTGDASLRARPMARVTGPLTEMGAQISGEMRNDNVYAPLRIAGGQILRGCHYEMPIASAQVKSALLLAGLYASAATTIVEPGPARDHTERMLAAMGAPIHVSEDAITLDPRGWSGALAAQDIVVPGDPSSAAFIIAAALVAGCERVTVSDVCINRTRAGFVEILGLLGFRVEREAQRIRGGEPVCDVAVSRGADECKAPTTIGGDVVVRAIDEIPVLAVVAATVDGVTRFNDVGELRVKESDRVKTTCALLEALGVETEVGDDWFLVRGGRPFSAATVDACGDHRIAMAAAVAGTAAQGPVVVNDGENVATSFPAFDEVMSKIGCRIEWQ